MSHNNEYSPSTTIHLGNPIHKDTSMAISIAVIGDIHDLWDVKDEAILKALGVDLVLFLGDFGNEAVEIVRQISTLNIPKAAILGNHDVWYSATSWGRSQCPYNRQQEDRVQEQLDLLGDSYVGYRGLDFPAFNLTVVGSRPFSWGGSEWKHKRFYRDRCQVKNFRESTERIIEAVTAAAHDTIIFLGHCGPYGLGDRPEDPCGKDWGKSTLGGDHGDPDLTDAIAYTQLMGKNVPLVAFGHMHHGLRHRTDCERIKAIINEDRTLYLNAASVPRIRKDKKGDRLYNLSLVTLEQGRVTQAKAIWSNEALAIHHEEILYSVP
ncbi:MAG: TIGR04168 family protein [Cyanobacteria bacterium P01_F01_bin.150]